MNTVEPPNKGHIASVSHRKVALISQSQRFNLHQCTGHLARGSAVTKQGSGNYSYICEAAFL